MCDLEQQLCKALKTVPSQGFTPELQAEVLDKVTHVQHMERTRRIGRASATILAVAAAAVVVVAGGFAYEYSQPSKAPGTTFAGNGTSIVNPGPIPAQFETAASALLTKYGLKPQYANQTIQTLKLPITYTDEPGAYPEGLYWAYHNVLSKGVGLDMTPYLGTTVNVHMIPVQHWTVGIPAYDENRTTYAIVITNQEHIIGAWISQGLNGSDYAVSLSKRYFAELTNQTWDQWLTSTGIVNYQKGVEMQRRSWTPDQVIRAYYSAINNKDYQTAWSLMTKSAQYQMMSMNLPDGSLYNDGYDNKVEGLHNITSVEVTSIKAKDLPPYTGNASDPVAQREEKLQYDLFNSKNYGQHDYEVNVVEMYKQVIARGNGPQTWFVSVVKESPDAPWKISGHGSGP
jgi:Fe-S cluster biosynthesis and repair protein YggX